MGPFWQYEEFDDRYPKKPASVTKKDISDFKKDIKAFIATYNSMAQDLFGCKNSSKMANFRPKMRILLHNAFLLELLNPENG